VPLGDGIEEGIGGLMLRGCGAPGWWNRRGYLFRDKVGSSSKSGDGTDGSEDWARWIKDGGGQYKGSKSEVRVVEEESRLGESKRCRRGGRKRNEVWEVEEVSPRRCLRRGPS
jgi:hypothetical protein